MKFMITTALVMMTASAFAATPADTKTTTAAVTTMTATTATHAAAAAPTTINGQADAKEGFSLIHVADLKTMKKVAGQVYIFDANNPKTRKTDGLIPGAKTLTGVSDYNVASTLPADKSAHVVFYCANTMCMASHAAANRAVAAGYQNVSVMADGIEGWKKAGQPTEMYK